MGICDGRIVVVTGAGRGIGREHALEFARQGARVVVNDLAGQDGNPAHDVVAEILAMGGQAMANGDDVSDWAGAHRCIQAALDTYGDVHVLVNNAGILRDRMFVSMSEAEWDDVIRVHLRGTFAPTKHALEHWREQSKAGLPVDARVINTSSPSGLFGNVGQTNYGAAKAALAGFTVILADEAARYGVTVNAIAPVALTRMTEALPGFSEAAKAAEEATGFNPFDPANVAPLVVWLGSTESAGISGRVFVVRGGEIAVAEGWIAGPRQDNGSRWDPALLGNVVPGLVAAARPNSDMSGEPRQPGQIGTLAP